ncbi:hypothetical protein DM01DRAFT_1303664 [Hesseltinella vesiculosa]|uniref:HECT-type E3 ubiquitin transferase n=1 Tax=Hesseltinella vesiculosa TaxID=101127 RepID=A0A1X2GKK5_9FUNG|nr:hypothetical protein DM01DRAFT_1303664 [Hesseltinella vesiculosa]
MIPSTLQLASRTSPFSSQPPPHSLSPQQKPSHYSQPGTNKTSSSTKRSSLSKVKLEYQEQVQRYLTQLVKGCGQSFCTNRFCASARGNQLCIDNSAALIIAMELVRQGKDRYCKASLANSTNPATCTRNGLALTSPSSIIHFASPTKKETTPDISRSPIPFLPQLVADMWRKDISLDHCLPPLCELDLASAQHVLKTRPTTLLRALFRQHLHGIGSCFLDPVTSFTNISDLVTLYQDILDGDASWPLRVDEHYEFLLDRILVNLYNNHENWPPIDVMAAWSRTLYCLSVWLNTTDQRMNSHHSTTTISVHTMTYKFALVFSKSAGTPFESHLVKAIAQLQSTRMIQLIDHLHHYLLSHFHIGPYRLGENDVVVAAVKALRFLFECNQQRDKPVPEESFVNEELLQYLQIKNEYRVWKRIVAYGEGRPSAATLALLQQSKFHQFHRDDVIQDQQRRSRLFMTTNLTSILLPYPFVAFYQFSWLSYPFLISASVKRKVLLMDCMAAMSREYEDACVNHTLLAQAQRLLASSSSLASSRLLNDDRMKSAICPYLLLEIRRDQIVEDTWHQVSLKWRDLKKPLKIKFVDGGEEGVDQGGVQKEYFAVLFEHLLSKSHGLFSLLTDDGEPSPFHWFRTTPDPDLNGYEMMGVLLGLAVYNGVLLHLTFPRIFWQQLLQPTVADLDSLPFSLQDLPQAWPQLAHGLKALLDYQGHDVEAVFCRNYEITISSFEQPSATVPLQPNGQWIPVTNANRYQYVQDYCRHTMFELHRPAILALRRGFRSVLGCPALALLAPSELEMITCGWQLGRHSEDLDMMELERITEYDDGYFDEHPVIRHFWSVVHNDFTREQKHKLLLFVTASDRIPVGGLKELTFVIQRNGPDSDRLPTALTCFSRLLLPEYSSKDKLRDRITTSIENSKGFGLV